MDWADRIFVMEGHHRTSIEQRHREHLGEKPIVCLRIPDRYKFMDPDLITLLEARMAVHFS